MKSGKASIVDGIMEAQERLLKEGIRANCVVVDRKYIQLRKRMYVTLHEGNVVIPPMIGGLRVMFDDLPDDTAFMVFEGHPPTTEWDRMKAENDAMREKLMKIKEVLGV